MEMYTFNGSNSMEEEFAYYGITAALRFNIFIGQKTYILYL